MWRSALWLLLAASLAAPVVFIWVRDHTPADGARISWYEDAWTADGVLIDPIDAPAAGLEDGDLVLAVDNRSIESWLRVVAVQRGGGLLSVEVDWATPSIGSALVEGWGFVVFSIVFGAVGAFVFARRPDEPAAIPLLFIASAASASSVPWFLGTTTSDLAQRSVG